VTTKWENTGRIVFLVIVLGAPLLIRKRINNRP
jgi:hypothetical protein